MEDSSSIVAPNEKKRKRPRAARACELCRAKKYRCDEMFPCSHCKRQKVDCVYDVADHVRQRMLQLSHSTTMEPTEQGRPERNGTGSVDSSSERLTPRESSHTTRESLGTGSPFSYTPAASRWTQVNAPGPVSAQDMRAEGATTQMNQADDDHEVEVSDINPHTQNVEFHGKTSSIAFLASLQKQSSNINNKTGPENAVKSPHHGSLVGIFHNEAFSPEALANVQRESVILEAERYYFRQAQVFLEGFFQNIHFIHPILDRQRFMTRCEDLWFGKANQQSKSFVALYYSIMSLGALIKTWDEPKFDGLGRLEWSRKFFKLAQTAIGSLASMTAVESVQCLFFMAKISQNELNPNLAYLYLGWATRAGCSAGFNRRQGNQSSTTNDAEEQISKLWWGLYSLEIEVSFALGRPDSLGADAYHNQVMPALNETETAIITVMVYFARIVKDVSLSIYLSEGTIHDKADAASDIEGKMSMWLQMVPAIIRPSVFESSRRSKITKAPTWAKRQKLVLELRFYNVKMVLFRPFLTVAAQSKQGVSETVRTAMDKCVDAAKSTIELMHEMYVHHAFFRTWWYNATYILYAASIILCYGIKVVSKAENGDYLELGHKAVEILDAMEESTVAQNASQTIKQILSTAEDDAEASQPIANQEESAPAAQDIEDNGMPQYTNYGDDSLMSFLDLDENLDFFGMMFPLNSSHFPILTEPSSHS